MRKWGPPQGSCTGSPPTGRRSPVTWTMKRLTTNLQDVPVNAATRRNDRAAHGRRRLGLGLGFRFIR
eukprot:332884-Prymnesium_polylepis.1